MDEKDSPEKFHKRKQDDDGSRHAVDVRRRRRSDEVVEKSIQREGRNRRQSESSVSNLRRRSPETLVSDSSLDHDTPMSSYKSASERITDEHVAMSPSVTHESPRTSENASEEIVWPTWISAMTLNPPPNKELEELVRRQRQRKQRREEASREALPSPIRWDAPSPSNQAVDRDDQMEIDVSSMKTAKAILVGSGWRALKDGRKVPIVSSQFRPATEAATDPRGLSYRVDLEERVSRQVWQRVAL